MATIDELLVRIDASTEGLRRELKKAEAAVESTSRTTQRAADQMGRALGALERQLDGVNRMAAAIGVSLSIGGILAFARAAGQVTAEFESLRASLVTVTGSIAAADEAFEAITEFATKTPYSVKEVTEAFIRLKSLGLDASLPTLEAYGNTASAMGKSIMQFIEAVADASTGEFERLKEFGIRASQQGDKVTFTFQGVSTTVRKTGEEIAGYLRAIGQGQFGGAMERQMGTLNGALSNLGDAWEQFLYRIGRAGLSEAILGVAGALEDVLAQSDGLADRIGAAFRELGKVIEYVIENAEILAVALVGVALLALGPFGAAVAVVGATVLYLASADDAATAAAKRHAAARKALAEVLEDSDRRARRIAATIANALVISHHVAAATTRAQIREQEDVVASLEVWAERQRGNAEQYARYQAWLAAETRKLIALRAEERVETTRAIEIQVQLARQTELGRQLLEGYEGGWRALMDAWQKSREAFANAGDFTSGIVAQFDTLIGSAREFLGLVDAAAGVTPGEGNIGANQGARPITRGDQFGPETPRRRGGANDEARRREQIAELREESAIRDITRRAEVAEAEGLGALATALRREIAVRQERNTLLEQGTLLYGRDAAARDVYVRDGITAFERYYDAIAAGQRRQQLASTREQIELQALSRRAEMAESAGARETADGLRREIAVRQERNALMEHAAVLFASDAAARDAYVARGVEAFARYYDALAANGEVQRNLQYIADAGERAFDRIGSAITEALAKGEISFASLGDIGRAVYAELAQEALKLSLINPLKNLIGLNGGQDLPTFGSVFGALFGQGQASPQPGVAVPTPRATGSPINLGAQALAGAASTGTDLMNIGNSCGCESMTRLGETLDRNTLQTQTIFEQMSNSLDEAFSGLGTLLDSLWSQLATMFAADSASSSGDGIMSIFGSLFSGAGSMFGGASSSAEGLGAMGSMTSTGGLYHAGTSSVVRGGGMPRIVRSSLFEHAPRFHAGVDLANDEVPAILQTGERVLNRQDARAYRSGQGPQKVEQHFHFDSPRQPLQNTRAIESAALRALRRR